MVRLLLAEVGVLSRQVCGSFNPTMVRLLQTLRRPVQIPATWFQSHNGAIAAGQRRTDPYGEGRFQSHNGAIAALKEWRLF